MPQRPAWLPVDSTRSIPVPRPRLWHGIGRQLAHPHGWAGWLTGAMMGVVNRGPNAAVLAALDLGADDTVLDAGCGAGQLMRAMLRQAWRVDGFDGSPLMVRQAAKCNAGAISAGRSSVKQGDFAALPYGDASFDRIAAANVIYFWQDIPAIIAEMRRVLRPGGRLVIYATAAESMAGWRFAQTGTHRLFTPPALEAELRAAAGDALTLAVECVAISGGITGIIATLNDRRAA